MAWISKPFTRRAGSYLLPLVLGLCLVTVRLFWLFLYRVPESPHTHHRTGSVLLVSKCARPQVGRYALVQTQGGANQLLLVAGLSGDTLQRAPLRVVPPGMIAVGHEAKETPRTPADTLWLLPEKQLKGIVL